MRLASILLVAVSIVVVASSGEARAQSINGLTASDFDLTSDPKGVSSDADEQYYWDMQKHSTTCVDYKPQYGSSTTLHLESLPPSFFANATPESIFPRAEPLPACVASGAQSDRLQDPISTNVAPPPLATNSAAAVANYRDVYGNHPTEIFADHAAYWFSFELAQYRAFSDPADAQALIATMLKWAKGGALTDNVQIGGNKGTVIYTMSTTMAPILNAYAELAPMMTPDQRRIVGPWINNFMIKLAGNSDPFRTQDHAAGWKLMIAEWGLATGNKAAVQYAIDGYKMSIHDMRPDGSFAADSSRGGSGLSYDNLITGDLVLTAAFLKTSLGADIFPYAVNGRSISTAVSYILAARDDPAAFNKKYAIACQSSKKTIDDPVVDFGLGTTFDISAYMPAFALLNPNDPISSRIIQDYRLPTVEAIFHPALGAPPLCLFDITAPGSKAVATRPLSIQTSEMKSYSNGSSPSFNSIWNAYLEPATLGGGDIDFNIIGTYDSASKDLSELSFVANDPIGPSEPKGLAKCGPEPRTTKYGDGQLRAILRFERIDGTWRALAADCIASAIPPGPALAIRVLAQKFPELADDMVASGLADGIGNDNLKTWIGDVASGEVKFGPPALPQ